MGIGQDFLVATKIPQLELSDQAKGMPCPPFEIERKNVKKIIKLPDPKQVQVKDVSLREAIETRQSSRVYADTPFSLDELSYLLWCTQGVKRLTENCTYRNVPSAGTRHAIETYLLINNVKELKQGLYKYIAIGHNLAELSCDYQIAQKVKDACPKGQFLENSAVTFIWSAVFYRMEWRHGQRGYRYIHIDAGHICQNLYLAAQGVNGGVCAVSVFDDDKLNEAVDVDGVNERVIYLAAAGKQKK